MGIGKTSIKGSVELKKILVDYLCWGHTLEESKNRILDKYETTAADIDSIAQQAEQEALAVYQKSQPDDRTIYMGGLGGIFGAVVSAFLWAMITGLTDGELGFVALGLGLVVGWSVLWFTGKKRSRGLQFVSMFFAALGVFFAQYLIFYYFFTSIALEGGAGLSIFFRFDWVSVELFGSFLEALPEMVDGYTILFLALAVFASWTVTQPFKLKK
jgi:hypothetical protein